MIVRYVYSRRESPASSARAFTLLELLLAVMIVAMLMTIAVPAIATLTRAANVEKSRGIVKTLATACSAFRDDFGEWPPSHEGAPYDAWLGAQLLPMFVTGYANDMGNDGIAGGDIPGVLDARMPVAPTNSNKLYEDDGVSGYGFRLAKGGRKYGPYFGAERLKTTTFGPGDRSVFIDAFGNPIFYYVWDGSDYDASDNDPNGPLSAVADYAEDASGNYYRRDIILAAAGPDGRFSSLTDNANDDITNLVAED